MNFINNPEFQKLLSLLSDIENDYGHDSSLSSDVVKEIQSTLNKYNPNFIPNLNSLLADSKVLDKNISQAVIFELQKLSDASGIKIEMGMGSIIFVQNESKLYYHSIFNLETMNKNPRYPKTKEEFLDNRKFKNPYISKQEAIAEHDEEFWNLCELKLKVAQTFYELVVKLDQHYPSQKDFPVLWDICGVCKIEPKK